MKFLAFALGVPALAILMIALGLHLQHWYGIVLAVAGGAVLLGYVWFAYQLLTATKL